MRLIVDTNFWIVPFRLGVDIIAGFSEVLDPPYEICVPRCVIEELHSVTKHRDAARKATALLHHVKPTILTGEGHCDDAIVDLLQPGDVVATQDRELRKRVKERGNQVVFVRGKSRLMLG